MNVGHVLLRTRPTLHHPLDAALGAKPVQVICGSEPGALVQQPRILEVSRMSIEEIGRETLRRKSHRYGRYSAISQSLVWAR